MQKNHFLSRFKKGFATSLGLGFGFICFGLIAYAFTTWNPGLVPQTNPANGNVKLAEAPVACPPTGWQTIAGYCISDASTTTYSKYAADDYCTSIGGAIPQPAILDEIKAKGVIIANQPIWTSKAWAGTYDDYAYHIVWYVYNFVGGTSVGGHSSGIPSSAAPAGGLNVRCVKLLKQ